MSGRNQSSRILSDGTGVYVAALSVPTLNNVSCGRGNEIGEEGALAVALGVANLGALETLDLGCGCSASAG